MTPKPHAQLGDRNLIVSVIVSGERTPVKVPTRGRCMDVVNAALAQSRNVGQPPERWELRTVDGRLLEPGVSLSDAGVVDGTTLYLSPCAGAGADVKKPKPKRAKFARWSVLPETVAAFPCRLCYRNGGPKENPSEWAEVHVVCGPKGTAARIVRALNAARVVLPARRERG